jgi:[ribosomal protein S5]-alanine N-acetyltransferase
MTSLNIDVRVPAAGRISLRPLELSDTERMFEIWSDPEVMRYYDIGPLTAIDEARMLASAMVQELEQGLSVRWAIVSKSSGNVIGSCGFRFEARFMSANVSFELARDAWHQGLMREALHAVITHAYDNWSINRIQAITDVDNQPTIRLLAKMGFLEEGVMRQWGYWKDAFHDARLFSLIKADQPHLPGLPSA